MSFASKADRDAIENEMPWADRDLPKTLYGLLSKTAGKFPDRPAVSYQIFSGPTDKAETVSWKELRAKTAQAANLFRSLGVGEKDVVAYVLPNANETIYTLLGGAVAGIANPINPLLEPEQIGAILRETGAKVVVTLKPFPKTDVAQKVAEAVRHAPAVHTILEVDLNRYLTPPKSWIVPLIRPKIEGNPHANIRSFTKEMAKQPTELTFEDSKDDRVAAYFHTGGTTGMPKVAQHLYSGMIYNGWLGHRLLFTEEDNIICPLPLFHVFACHVILMAALASGAHVVFPTPQGYRGEGVFDNFWKLVERWKITFVITVPTAVSALMQRKVDADVSSVKTAFSGSAPMPMELFKRFEAASGVTVVEGYGLTEATCLVSCNPPDGEKKVGSIGIPFPYTEVKIVKQTDQGPQECAVDEIGEICISNPGVYEGATYTEAEKNRDLFHEGRFLRTGDLGRIDADGYLWITGRAKDLIIRGGHNIDPAEIEEALLTHPAVAFAGAIGQPDAHSGEMPCAYVELVAGGEVTPEELIEHCKIHVHERAAQPKHMDILDELPKTAVGKVFKPDLRKMAITRVYNDALEKADCPARVTSVIDDKKRGLVAQVAGNGAPEGDINAVLSAFVRPWEYAEEKAVAAE
ncbi:fatty-acyl-CoA synthase/long-chain acyl-CoA synthetase [Roseivivax lentus]|uniref:Fatty-acyl-CoA synthase/long-chain acyl-CoA synthetase n=1 Tax=Roseivivax lentus TaxID=633194 RepID=A0A1N7PLK3_9RHOB|nr:acyl-CoA synthetase [Roseivivax lentus]SIT11347.1 fatty-acyl-CoA synthase/long-chain acyl-CoA synthetase [Roseivivax lentus]